jgi:hypothetical protein
MSSKEPHLLLLSVIDGLPLAKIPRMNLHRFNKSLEDGLPLAKTLNHNLLNQIISSKDDQKVLLDIVADADPAKLHEIISLVRDILRISENELKDLQDESDSGDVAYENAVNDHNAAIVAQTNGLTQLSDAYDIAEAAAKAIYDQGVISLQAAVDAAKVAEDSASSAKNTANGVLSAERTRLESEISSLKQVIAIIEGVIGINTVAPTVAPTLSPTVSPTRAPTVSPTRSPTAAPTKLVANCITIQTGGAKYNDGYLKVYLLRDGSHVRTISGGGSLYSLNSYIYNSCGLRSLGVNGIEISNPTNNAWTGTITMNNNYASCYNCRGGSSTYRVVVDGNADSSNQASTRCLNGRYCYVGF